MHSTLIIVSQKPKSIVADLDVIATMSPMWATIVTTLVHGTQQNFNGTISWDSAFSKVVSPQDSPSLILELAIYKVRIRMRQRSVLETRHDDEAIEVQNVQNYSCL